MRASVVISALNQTQSVFRQVKGDLAAIVKGGAEANAASQRLGGRMMLLGGGALAGMAAFVYKTAEMGEEMSLAAKRTNMTVETLSAMQYAAGQSGARVEDLQTSLKFLSRNAYAAATQGGAASAKFSMLGVDVRNTNGSLKASDQLFMQVATKLQKLGPGMAQTALATQIFGRGALTLIPLLQRGGAGIEALMEKAKKLGLVMHTEDVEAAAGFMHQLEGLKQAFMSAAMTGGGVFFRALTSLAQSMTTNIGHLAVWIDHHRTLTKWIGYTSAALAGLLLAGGFILKLMGMFGLWRLGAALTGQAVKKVGTDSIVTATESVTAAKAVGTAWQAATVQITEASIAQRAEATAALTSMYGAGGLGRLLEGQGGAAGADLERLLGPRGAAIARYGRDMVGGPRSVPIGMPELAPEAAAARSGMGMGRMLGIGGGAVGLGLSAYEGYKSGEQGESPWGAVAGGAMSGAMIGSMIAPGIGTAIGAVIGAGIGYAGNALGKTHHVVEIQGSPEMMGQIMRSPGGADAFADAVADGLNSTAFATPTL
jgi:hypothetical protein